MQICPTSFQALIPLEQNVGLTQAVNLSSSVVLRSIKKIGHTVAVVRASSIEGRLPSNVVFHRMSSSIEDRACDKNITLGFELMLEKEGPKNLFRILQ